VLLKEKNTIILFGWILTPFVVAKTDLSGCEEEELAGLSSDRSFMISFNQTAVSSFWLSAENEYPLLSQKATKLLLPFATICMCETEYSSLTNMQETKYGSRLTGTLTYEFACQK